MVWLVKLTGCVTLCVYVACPTSQASQPFSVQLSYDVLVIVVLWYSPSFVAAYKNVNYHTIFWEWRKTATTLRESVIVQGVKSSLGVLKALMSSDYLLLCSSPFVHLCRHPTAIFCRRHHLPIVILQLLNSIFILPTAVSSPLVPCLPSVSSFDLIYSSRSSLTASVPVVSPAPVSSTSPSPPPAHFFSPSTVIRPPLAVLAAAAVRCWIRPTSSTSTCSCTVHADSSAAIYIYSLVLIVFSRSSPVSPAGCTFVNNQQ